MEHFAVRREWNGASLVHRLTDFVAPDLARPVATTPAATTKDQAAVGIDSAHMGTGHAQGCVLNGNAGAVFRLLDRFLNGSHCFVEINNDAFTRASRVTEPMTAVA